MQIGIISDSHDHHSNVLRAIEILNEHKVDYVLHAGDIVSPFTAKAFANLRIAKFIAVFGNNEGEKLFLKSTIESFNGEIHEYCYNRRAIVRFHYETKRLVFKWLNRRSQKASFTWEDFEAYLKQYPLPAPRIVHHLYTLSFDS